MSTEKNLPKAFAQKNRDKAADLRTELNNTSILAFAQRRELRDSIAYYEALAQTMDPR